MGGVVADRRDGVRWGLFEGVPPDDVRRVLSTSRRRKFPRGQALFHEGDPGDTVHLIDRGHVSVRVTTPLGDTATLRILGPGDVVGELAAVMPAPRNATVVSIDGVETLAIHRDELTRLRREHPTVDQVFLTAMVGSVRRLSTQLLEALYVPVPDRVVHRLAEVAAQFDDGARPVVVPLTQDDLAGLAGAARPTVNRVLNDLQRDGLIELRRGRVLVPDPAALAR